jgi:hypothetical protein
LRVINKEDALPVFDHLRKSQRCAQNGKALKHPDLGFTIFKEIQQPSRAGQAGCVCELIFTVYNDDTKSPFWRTLLSLWGFAKDASVYTSTFFSQVLAEVNDQRWKVSEKSCEELKHQLHGACKRNITFFGGSR